VVGKKCSLTVLVLVNAQSIMHIVFQLNDVLRFDSTAQYNYIVINVLFNKLNNKFFLFRSRMHKYASGLTSTPKAELFCSCKHRKFVGQSKVKISSF